MAFGEIFSPGMANAREQAEAERILPAPPPVAGPPPFELPDLGVEFDVHWSPEDASMPWENRSANDNGEPAAADSPSSKEE